MAAPRIGPTPPGMAHKGKSKDICETMVWRFRAGRMRNSGALWLEHVSIWGRGTRAHRLGFSKSHGRRVRFAQGCSALAPVLQPVDAYSSGLVAVIMPSPEGILSSSNSSSRMGRYSECFSSSRIGPAAGLYRPACARSRRRCLSLSNAVLASAIALLPYQVICPEIVTVDPSGVSVTASAALAAWLRRRADWPARRNLV